MYCVPLRLLFQFLRFAQARFVKRIPQIQIENQADKMDIQLTDRSSSPKCHYRSLLNHRFGGLIYPITVISLVFYHGYHASKIMFGDQHPYHVAAAIFIMLQIFVNVVCIHLFAYRNTIDYLIASNNHHKSIGMSPTSDPSAVFHKNCPICSRNVPIRSHHCSICRYCVVKCDHHCIFLGACIGYGNQRFFIVFLFWTAMGALYGSMVNILYANTHILINPWSSSIWIDYLVYYCTPKAYIDWLYYGTLTFGQFCYVSIICIGLYNGIGSTLFFIFQMYLVSKDITSFEIFKKKFHVSDDPRVWKRIESVFGPCWYLNFLIPMPALKNSLDESLRNFLYRGQLKSV